MNPLHKIIRITLLLTIYVAGFYVSITKLAGFREYNIAHKKELRDNITTTSQAFYFFTRQSKSTVSILTENVPLNLKVPFDTFKAIRSGKETLLNSIFKQYLGYFNTLWIRHRKSDLIFPFHTFW